MPNIKKVVSDKRIWILLLIICIFIALSIYYYKTIVQPKLNKQYVANKEFLPEDNSSGGGAGNNQPKKGATLYYFYTTWCPHCKAATPQWKALQDETNGVVNGVNIVFKDIDCDQDTSTADKFKVAGYPTIKLIYDNKIYDYDAKPNKDTLIQFLNSVL